MKKEHGPTPTPTYPSHLHLHWQPREGLPCLHRESGATYLTKVAYLHAERTGGRGPEVMAGANQSDGIMGWKALLAPYEMHGAALVHEQRIQIHHRTRKITQRAMSLMMRGLLSSFYQEQGKGGGERNRRGPKRHEHGQEAVKTARGFPLVQVRRWQLTARGPCRVHVKLVQSRQIEV